MKVVRKGTLVRKEDLNNSTALKYIKVHLSIVQYDKVGEQVQHDTA